MASWRFKIRHVDFVLIDLVSQRDAVANHVRGWATNAILAWMSRYGEMRYFPDLDMYAFRSFVDGRITGFRFIDEGQLCIFGAN